MMVRVLVKGRNRCLSLASSPPPPSPAPKQTVVEFFFFFLRFQVYFISSNMLYFNGYIVLLLGINYELILKQFSIKSAGMITVLSIPLG